LLELTDGSIKSELAAEIKAKWQALGGARMAIRAFRNKRLAHNDLAFVSGATTIESVHVRDIEAVLRGMRDILETLALRDGGINIELETGHEGDAAKALLESLQRL
jgi:hypothetical protein